MYTYRIYLDGGNLVIGTYESNVLKGEAKHLPRGLVAVAGNTNTTITLNRVVNNLPTLANIEHTNLRNSNGATWGSTRNDVINALNAFFTATGGGLTSINGDTGPIVVLTSDEISRRGNDATTIDFALAAVEESITTLFTIVGKSGAENVIKDKSNATRITVTTATTSVQNVLKLEEKANPPAVVDGGLYVNNTRGELFFGLKD